MALVAFGSGCKKDGPARKRLEKEGFTNIELTPASKGFDFKAKKGGQDCTGHISIEGLDGQSYSMTHTCVEAQAESKITTCPDAPLRCFDDGREAMKNSDFATAAAKYRLGCDAGEGGCCNNLAVLHEGGKGVEKSQEKAIELYGKSCKKMYGLGCRNQGVLLVEKKEMAQALAAYELGCTLKDADACNRQGALLREGVAGKPNLDKAAALFKQACDAGATFGCVNLATAQIEGQGVPQDDAVGMETLKKQCMAGTDEANENACFYAGLYETKGTRSIKPDLKAAVDHYVRACDGKVGPACNNLAVLHASGQGVPRDEAKAVALYLAACDLDFNLGCSNAGHFHREGRGVKRDPKKAAELFEKACRLGDAEACEEGKKRR